MSATIPVSFPDEQAEEIRAASERSGLSQQDIIRQAFKLGLGTLLDKLSPAKVDLSPLPEETVAAYYANMSDEDVAADKAMSRASLKSQRK